MKTREARCHRMFAGMTCMLAMVVGASGVHATGVAALKEWDFHRDCSARPVVYSRIIDSRGPYLRLVTERGNVDILRTKLAGFIEVPDDIPACLMEEKDVAPLRKALAAMTGFSKRYPMSERLLGPPSGALAGHLARFDAGEVRFEGGWMGRSELKLLLENRRHGEELKRRREIEQVVLLETQEDKGLVMLDGEWVERDELRNRPASARTELSDTLWPLLNPTGEGARMAMENLSSLAARQKGAMKVRTERVHAVIRHLFLAEYRLSRQIVASAAAEAAAVAHDRRVKEWLKPNAFGTVRKDEALKSHQQAVEIRSKSAALLDECRGGLLAQLQEADRVTCDLHRLREDRATLFLSGAVRTIAARRFPSGEFQSSLPDDSLAAIRTEMASRK